MASQGCVTEVSKDAHTEDIYATGFGSGGAFTPSSTPGFGTPPTSLFNSSSPAPFGTFNTTPAFGTQQSTAGFGTTSTSVFGAQSTSAFGSNTSSGFGGFGSQPFASASSPSPFGPSSTPAPFGQPQLGSSPFNFGNTAAPAQQIGSSPSLFASSTPGFGQQQAGAQGGFGQQTNIFGQPQQQQQAASKPGFGGTLFSSSAPFGQQTTPGFGSTLSIFGQPTSPAPTGGIFGTVQQPSSGLFGAQQPQQQQQLVPAQPLGEPCPDNASQMQSCSVLQERMCLLQDSCHRNVGPVFLCHGISLTKVMVCALRILCFCRCGCKPIWNLA